MGSNFRAGDAGKKVAIPRSLCLFCVFFLFCLANLQTAQAQRGTGIRFRGLQFKPRNFDGFNFKQPTFRRFPATPIQFRGIPFQGIQFAPPSSPAVERNEPSRFIQVGRRTDFRFRSRSDHLEQRVGRTEGGLDQLQGRSGFVKSKLLSGRRAVRSSENINRMGRRNPFKYVENDRPSYRSENRPLQTEAEFANSRIQIARFRSPFQSARSFTNENQSGTGLPKPSNRVRVSRVQVEDERKLAPVRVAERFPFRRESGFRSR